MASTLLRRYRALLASVSDDYFDDPDCIDHINDAKKTIVSTAIKLEMDQPKKFGRSIRALNSLRVEQTYNTLSFTAVNGYHQADIDASNIEEDNLLYISAKTDTHQIICTEILENRRYEMNLGLIQPLSRQAYWRFFTDVTPDPDEEKIRLFFASNDASTEVSISYIKSPQPIDDTSEDLIDLPDRLIKAVMYRAVLDGANAEIRENAGNFLELYNSELETHLW